MQVVPSIEALGVRDPTLIHPVWAEVLCDFDTPLGAFSRLCGDFSSLPGSIWGDRPTRFLFESVVGGQRWARYSILGLGHRARVVASYQDEKFVVEVEPGPGFSLPQGVRSQGEGLEAIRALLSKLRSPPQDALPRFWGGLVGVWGHDFVRCVERLPVIAGRESSSLPAVELLATDTTVIFDNLTQRVKVVATACPQTDGGVGPAHEAAAARITAVCERLRQARTTARTLNLNPPDPDEETKLEPAPPWSRARHRDAIAKAREHIEAGDIFQVVLSQKFQLPLDGLDLLDVYRILRVTNPAPYMYLLDLPSATLVGASPEVLVRVDRDTREVTVRPIAGTRPRGVTQAEDEALERELLADPKELAEHVMLIDLGRNDVGRVCDGGTVRMTETFAIERYSRVMHVVSEVTGRLRREFDALDALAATFPAGTLSGAPKVRALEIIDELEPSPRDWYGGAVGYIGYDGGADFAICIRSLVAHGDHVTVQAGGGIVYDSDPAAEDQESRNKASAVVRAIAMARQQGARS